MRDIYNVDVRSLDFENAPAAAQYINKVLSDATNGRITDVINAGLFHFPFEFEDLQFIVIFYF